MNGCVAVFDLGKTNIKVVVFDLSGDALAERARANAPLAADAQCPYLSLDARGRLGFPDRRAQGRGRALSDQGDLDRHPWRAPVSW